MEWVFSDDGAKIVRYSAAACSLISQWGSALQVGNLTSNSTSLSQALLKLIFSTSFHLSHIYVSGCRGRYHKCASRFAMGLPGSGAEKCWTLYSSGSIQLKRCGPDQAKDDESAVSFGLYLYEEVDTNEL